MFKYKTLCLLLCLCSFTALTSNGQTTSTATNTNTGFSSVLDTDKYAVGIPNGWQHFNRESGGFTALVLAAPVADDFMPSLNILMEGVQNATLDEYLELAKKATKNMTFESEGDIEVNDVKGKYLNSTATQNDITASFKTYVFVKNGIAYILTGTCLKKQKETYQPIFDAIVQTFKIKTPAANGQVTSNPVAVKINLSSVLDTTKFSIAIQDGWQHHTREASGFSALVIVGPRVDGYLPSLNILSEKVWNTTLDEYVKLTKKNAPELTVMSEAYTEANGVKGKYLNSNVTSHGITMFVRSYLFIKKGTAYVLTASCMPNQKETYLPVFDAMVQSFKIK